MFAATEIVTVLIERILLGAVLLGAGFFLLRYFAGIDPSLAHGVLGTVQGLYDQAQGWAANQHSQLPSTSIAGVS